MRIVKISLVLILFLKSWRFSRVLLFFVCKNAGDLGLKSLISDEHFWNGNIHMFARACVCLVVDS